MDLPLVVAAPVALLAAVVGAGRRRLPLVVSVLVPFASTLGSSSTASGAATPTASTSPARRGATCSATCRAWPPRRPSGWSCSPAAPARSCRSRRPCWRWACRRPAALGGGAQLAAGVRRPGPGRALPRRPRRHHRLLPLAVRRAARAFALTGLAAVPCWSSPCAWPSSASAPGRRPPEQALEAVTRRRRSGSRGSRCGSRCASARRGPAPASRPHGPGRRAARGRASGRRGASPAR